MAASLQNIKREIAQEKQGLATAQKAVEALKEEIAELEVAFPGNEPQNSDHRVHEPDSIDYKSRYEHQAQCNRKLKSDVEELRKRIQYEKRKSKALPQTDEEEFYGAQGKRLLIKLQREKINLESQMRDSEWKLDEEARTFHKVDEKRKQVIRDVQRSGGNVGQILAKVGGGVFPSGPVTGRRESKTLESISEMPLSNNTQRRASIKEQPAANKRSPLGKKKAPVSSASGLSSHPSKPQSK